MRTMSHRKQTSHHVDRRLDHKKERAAVRQVLDGGHVRQPQLTNWSSPNEPIPVIDDTMPHKAHKTGCPKNHGGLHEPVPNWGWRSGAEHVCKYCNKSFYGRGTGNWLVRDPGLLS